MQEDQQAIRELIAQWHFATALGDIDTVLTLMAEDVTFLVAGQPPMRGRAAFAAGFKMATQHGRIESRGDIQEIQVSGDLAYCWSNLEVTVISSNGGEAKHLAGPALSVLRKSAEGNWEMFRDANMLKPVEAS